MPESTVSSLITGGLLGSLPLTGGLISTEAVPVYVPTYFPGDDALTGGLGVVVGVLVPPEPEIAADLLGALWVRSEEDVGLLAEFGRAGWLWKGKGARGVPLPYGVVFETGTTESLTTSGVHHEHIGLQFNLYASTETQAKRLGEAVRDLYTSTPEWEPVEFQGGTDEAHWPGDGDILEREDVKGSGGATVFVQRVNFVWRVGRGAGVTA